MIPEQPADHTANPSRNEAWAAPVGLADQLLILGSFGPLAARVENILNELADPQRGSLEAADELEGWVTLARTCLDPRRHIQPHADRNAQAVTSNAIEALADLARRGDPTAKATLAQACETVFGLSRLDWINPGRHLSLKQGEEALKRHQYDVVWRLVRYTDHQTSQLARTARDVGAAFIQVPAGTSAEMLAYHLLEQAQWIAKVHP